MIFGEVKERAREKEEVVCKSTDGRIALKSLANDATFPFIHGWYRYWCSCAPNYLVILSFSRSMAGPSQVLMILRRCMYPVLINPRRHDGSCSNKFVQTTEKDDPL